MTAAAFSHIPWFWPWLLGVVALALALKVGLERVVALALKVMALALRGLWP